MSKLNAQYALPKAGLAAVLAGDGALATSIVERLSALNARGRAIETDLAVIEAGIAALSGRRDEAQNGYRSARLAFRELGLPWDEALVAITAASTLGGAEPEIAGWLADARKTMATVKARPLVDMIDRLAGPRAEGPEAASSADQLAESRSST
jgi:hypothetical protein